MDDGNSFKEITTTLSKEGEQKKLETFDLVNFDIDNIKPNVKSDSDSQYDKKTSSPGIVIKSRIKPVYDFFIPKKDHTITLSEYKKITGLNTPVSSNFGVVVSENSSDSVNNSLKK